MGLFSVALVLTFVTTLWAVNPYDPGICTREKRGKFVVVKDYNDDDTIVVCVHRGGKYQWNMFNGHSHGNYFDPAKDCSDVVDNDPKAKSGVYWIQTQNGPQKSWCDVKTDGGGFLLIGVKDTPETWAIPSNTSFIHPHGKSMWSSAFGEKKVLDFRVQISTTEDFRDTRAHWYYRFNSPRKLSKLLMSNKGGCSHRYPGIGDVAFVKDLMARKIATKTFNCSRFGGSMAMGFGWSKMNRCFKKACPNGFAYLFKFLIDTSGSYSYSVASERSGIHDKQTAFIGCDHGKCCACFGPDSKGDYCAPRCRAINGGTILKKEDNITVWFWIRSSLPKRVGKECTEFNERNNAGKLETWHVKDGIKERGSCSQDQIKSIIDELKSFKQVVNDTFKTVKKDVKILTHGSCNQILKSRSNNGSGVYQISVGQNQVINVFCQMSSVSGCSGGGWTMVMKIDGRKSTFRYSSSYWVDKNAYNDSNHGRNGGFDNRQYKGPSYWRISFNEICVAMKYGGQLRAFSFSYPASSLYDLIADGNYRQTHVGRSKWKQLIYGSSLQRNCNQEGFNVFVGTSRHTRVRLGLVANEQNNCQSPDSFLGLGAEGGTSHSYRWCGSSLSLNTAGNMAQCEPANGKKNAKAMGYILVR